MATPTLVTITGQLRDAPTHPDASATVTFKCAYFLRHADGTVIEPFKVVGVADADGQISVQVPAQDDPDWLPTGWTYRVVIDPNDGTPVSPFDAVVSVADAQDGLNLGEMLPVGSPSAGVIFAPVNHTHDYVNTDQLEDAITAFAGSLDLTYATDAQVAQAISTALAGLDTTYATDVQLASGVTTAKAYTDEIPARIPLGAVRIDPDLVSAVHAAAPLTTPTSDGSGQCVHPGMYYNPAGWGADTNGKSWRYWMAMTPYPGGLEDVENPEILVSDDGITWVVPPGLTNPIDDPAVGFYPDPELIMVDGVLWCVYAVNKAKSSTNGITWSSQYILPNVGGSGSVCPTVQRIGSEFWLWTVYKTVDASPYVLRLQKSTTINGTYGSVINCTFPVPTGKDVWHISIRKVGDQYCAVAALCDKGTSGTNTELYFAVSDNGVVWRVSAKPLLSPVLNTWTSQQIYQSSIVPLDGRDGRLFQLWYSGVQNPNIWRIGYTEIVSVRARTGLALTASPNTLAAGQTGRGDARNRLTNPTLLVAAAGATVPTGYSNNLVGFSGHAWEESTEAFTALRASGTGGGNLQLVHTDTFVPGEVWTTSVEIKLNDGAAGTFTISTQWLTAADATIGSAAISATYKDTDFRRVIISSTVPATAAKLRISLNVNVLANPCQYWWRRIQLEKAASFTTYFPNMAFIQRAAAGQVSNLTEWQTALAAGSGGGARVPLAVTKDGRLKTGTTNEQTTVGAAGGASGLPATPTKYLRVELADGTQVVIPAYLQA